MFFNRNKTTVVDADGTAVPAPTVSYAPRRVRRRSWFLFGLFCGIIVLLVLTNPPDKVAQNLHSWIALFTGASDSSKP